MKRFNQTIKQIAVLSVGLGSCFQPAYPKFFKKLRKSVTKRLKEAVTETIPITQLIIDSERQEEKRETEIENTLLQARKLLEQAATEDVDKNELIAEEETVRSLASKLTLHLLLKKIDAKKKNELKAALNELTQLGIAIAQIRGELS